MHRDAGVTRARIATERELQAHQERGPDHARRRSEKGKSLLGLRKKDIKTFAEKAETHHSGDARAA